MAIGSILVAGGKDRQEQSQTKGILYLIIVVRDPRGLAKNVERSYSIILQIQIIVFVDLHCYFVSHSFPPCLKLLLVSIKQ